MSKLFLLEYIFILLLTIKLVEPKMKAPPIKIWDKKLSEFFSTHNFSNYIDIGPKKCLNNESYYLFVMQTIFKYKDTNDEVETLGYTGFCLNDYNITPVEHSLINYYYLWDTSHMNSSSLIEVKKLSQENEYLKDTKTFKFKFVGALLILYLFFIIVVTLFPKKIDDKYNLKELERIKKEREEDNNSDNNINNINNDDYEDNYNLLKIKNDEDKPPADIIVDLASDKIHEISENISNYNRNSVNEGDESKKEKKPKIKEISIYNELFFNKKNKDRLWNSFNIIQNMRIVCEFSSLRPLNKLKPIEMEIFIMETFKCLSYLILMYYTCLPIIERLPFKEPEKFYELVKRPYLIFLFKADFFYNTLFLIEGIYISYFYLYNSKNICLPYIVFEIIYKIIPIYILLVILYFFFFNSDIFLNNPLSKYFYQKEHTNCECQEINIFLLIANFTYGTKEKFFPFCLYHFWYVFTWMQYYVIGLLLLLCYINFRAFFYVIYIIIYFVCFSLRLISFNMYSPPFTVFNLIQRNLKTYFQRSGLKIFTRAGPFLIGFLFGIYYYENKKSKNSLLAVLKKNNSKLLFFSIFFLFFNFAVHYNLNYISKDHYLAIILTYAFKVFTHDIFILGVLGLLIYFFINIEKSAKIFRIFKNHLFLLLKKLSLTSYLVMSIIARIFFYSLDKPYKISAKRIITHIFGGLAINLIISLLLNILFVIPFQRVNSIIKSTYIKTLEEEDVDENK